MRTAWMAIALALALGTPSPIAASPCVNVFHDEAADGPSSPQGPINAIMLANLLGHWPEYEVRVRPIDDYQSDFLEGCRATFYLGTDDDTPLPAAFLRDFFTTDKSVAWIGFGVKHLDSRQLEEVFLHRVSGQIGVDDPDSNDPAFYQHVSYKGSVFHKFVERSSDKAEGAFEAVRFLPVSETAGNVVVAELIHNKTYATNPYFLRAGSKFIVGDIPFAYMHEGDRYFAFSDLLFDILNEAPVHRQPLAFARMEDIHAYYEITLVKAAMSAVTSEGVPVSIAHIPLFMDPFDAYGQGKVETPESATEFPDFATMLKGALDEPRNAIVWHGVTHQLGLMKNPHSGTSGDDYEFWDMASNRPVEGETVASTLDRLAMALPVFDAFGASPRFWVTPHYQASALSNRVFADVFPWQIGRVTYYSSSFGPTFTLPAATRNASSSIPSVTRQRIDELKSKQWAGIDTRSEGGLTQMFPFEIYRDVYGQRIMPETLGYMSYATTDQTAFIRTADDMLADARRNRVVRDYWASFFYHPYIFSHRDNGGIGRFEGDTIELRKLLIGLKMLGYKFVGVSEFETSTTKQDFTTAAVPSRTAD